MWAKATYRTKLYDLSLPVTAGMPVFPGDPPCTVHDVTHYDDAGYRVSKFSLGSHTGTHVDAPSHFLPGAAGVDALALEVLVGPARVVDVRHRGVGEEITLEDVVPALPCTRLVLCAGWDRYYGGTEYFANPPGLQLAAAQAMVAAGVQLVGLDTPNVHALQCTALHRYLLTNGVVLVEGLCGLEPLIGLHLWLMVAPLPVVGADGAPARVLALANSRQGDAGVTAI